MTDEPMIRRRERAVDGHEANQIGTTTVSRLAAIDPAAARL